LSWRNPIVLGAAAGVVLGLAVLVLAVTLIGDDGSASENEDSEAAAQAAPAVAEPGPGQEEPVPVVDGGEPVVSTDLRPVALFFSGGQDFLLLPEVRKIFWTASLTDRARQVVNELLRGPTDDGELAPSIPAGLTLREVYVMPGGTCWVDLSTSGRRPQIGSQQEWAAVESLALSLTANFAEIQRVGVLLDGEQSESLAGHLDLRRTFTGREWLPPGVRLEDLLPGEVLADREIHGV
jgi:spore germination protein GerM